MQLNNLIKNNKKKIRVGRGIGTGKGKTIRADCSFFGSIGLVLNAPLCALPRALMLYIITEKLFLFLPPRHNFLSKWRNGSFPSDLSSLRR